MQLASADDIEIIEKWGGPVKLARLLGYEGNGGIQRVVNWRTRGIPPRVKLEHPEIFLSPRPATHPTGES